MLFYFALCYIKKLEANFWVIKWLLRTEVVQIMVNSSL